MLVENLPLRGHLNIALNGETVHEVHNLVVTAGTEWVAKKLLQSTTEPDATKMGIGAGTADTVATDSALNVGAATALTANIKTFQDAEGTASVPTVTGASIEFKCTFIAGEGTGDVTEAGLFTSADILIARTKFGQVTKDADDEMTITWTISVSGA